VGVKLKPEQKPETGAQGSGKQSGASGGAMKVKGFTSMVWVRRTA